jgi:hypothetical protein
MCRIREGRDNPVSVQHYVMWGHAGRQAIKHLPESVDGLELVDGDLALK